MNTKAAQRFSLGAVVLALLAGCGQSTEADVAAAESPAPAATSSSPTTPEEAAATESTAAAPVPSEDETLRAAVQGYSDGFLGGEPTVAYEYFSARCKEQVSLSYFTGIVIAAKQAYGAALPLTSYDAEVSGDLARVTYAYDVPALDQTSEPWAREGGAWKQDDC